MRDEITKKYSNGEITVVWQPSRCIHSTICWKGLREVFDPEKRPWVNMQGAESDQIAAQVEKCPSGALSYFRNNEAISNAAENTTTVIEVQPNGPLIVKGTVTVKHAGGDEEQKHAKTAFCRCGQSGKKPYCDGTHKKVGFEG